MSGQKICLLALLLVSLACMPGCVSRSSSSSSSPLVHGLNSSSRASTSAGSAKVIKVSQEVVAIHDGRADKLQPGMMVPVDSILRSNAKGSAELAFDNGATIKIAPNSEIDLASVAPAAAAAQKDAGSGKSLTRSLSDVFGRGESQSSRQATIGVRGLK